MKALWKPKSSSRTGAKSVRRSFRLASKAGVWMLAVCLAGCSHTNPRETIGNNTSDVDAIMHDVDSGVQQVTYDQSFDEPVTIKAVVEDDGTNDGNPVDDYYDVSLDKVIELAMTNSTVLRDLGATLLRTPQLISTRYQKALMETNPQFGIEAALSAYDAQLSAKANFQNNDRIINNRFYGGGTSLFAQDRHDYVAQISKRGATGAEFALRGITDYDSNNAPANLFGSAWQTQVEGELRQPLLQGGGLTFNRIAGPGATPGVYNGVLVAKVTNDINATEFERQMQSYVSEVENAYWDLYFAYRDLDAKQQALENARSTWEKASKRGTSADRPEEEPLTREQYFRFQSELQDAISGKLGQRTQNYNGVTGGSIRGFNGVQVAERRLRLLIGESVNSRTLLRPTTVPESAPFVWDWNAISCEALQRRPELRNQRLIIKRRQMELLASKNFLSPKLDAIGRYRVRGLGQDLMGGGTDVIAPNRTLGSAVDELGNFNHQEWELGVEFSMPLGFRKAHMAVQNAELQVARDLAVLHEQERQIIHDLSNAKAETERALEQREINLNRWLAAKDAVNTLTNRVEIDVNFEVLLDAQRRLLEAQTAYHLSAVEYEIAEKNVHLEKGSLLNQHNVQVDSPLNDAQVVMPLDTLWLPPAVGTSGAAAGNEQAARVKPKRDVIQVSGESAGFPARK